MNRKEVGHGAKTLGGRLSPDKEFYGERGSFVCCDEGVGKHNLQDHTCDK